MLLAILESAAMRLPLASADKLVARGIARLGKRSSARACEVDCDPTHLGSTCNIFPHCYWSMDNCNPNFFCDCNICP